MIEVNQDEIVEFIHYKPFDDSRDELLETLYALLAFIHKEPFCINYELFIEKDGSLMTVGRWRDRRAYNLHENMQYMSDFYRTKMPVFCKEYEKKESRVVVGPLSALSLMNEK